MAPYRMVQLVEFAEDTPEYTLVPRDRVLPVRAPLPWSVLAALPDTWLTALGSVVEAMGMA